MVRVFEAKPPGQLPGPSGQLPWAAGTQRAAGGHRPPPPRPQADPERELTLLEEARRLAAQVRTRVCEECCRDFHSDRILLVSLTSAREVTCK